MIIAIDFDGTLHTGQYPAIGIAAPYAKVAMDTLHELGHYLIINTCRSGDLLTEAVNWLLAQGIPFDRVNDNHPGNTEKYSSNSRKIYAHLYVDDKQVGGLPPWLDVVDWVVKMEKEYNEKKE